MEQFKRVAPDVFLEKTFKNSNRYVIFEALALLQKNEENAG